MMRRRSTKAIDPPRSASPARRDRALPVRRIVAAFAIASLASLPKSTIAQPTDASRPAPTIDRARLVALSASVMRVEVRRTQGGYGYGSGVMLTSDRIATNCHVTRDATVAHVLRGGVRWRAEAQIALPQLDVCILRVPGMVGTPVTVRRGPPLREGDAVAALGFVGGVTQPVVSVGDIVGLYAHEGGEVIQSSTHFTSGASGGGLFDAEGALIGLLTFRMRGGVQHYFAAPAVWLAKLLDASQPEQPIAPQPAPTPAYWELAESRRPFFLQALDLEQRRAWSDLGRLVAQWRKVDGNDRQLTRFERLSRQDVCAVKAENPPC